METMQKQNILVLKKVGGTSNLKYILVWCPTYFLVLLAKWIHAILVLLICM